jgi:hypothetical protein
MMGRAINRMNYIDWIVDETKPDEKKIEEWTIELKKFLLGCGIIRNRENVERVVRQRFRLRKGNWTKML